MDYQYENTWDLIQRGHNLYYQNYNSQKKQSLQDFKQSQQKNYLILDKLNQDIAQLQDYSSELKLKIQQHMDALYNSHQLKLVEQKIQQFKQAKQQLRIRIKEEEELFYNGNSQSNNTQQSFYNINKQDIDQDYSQHFIIEKQKNMAKSYSEQNIISKNNDSKQQQKLHQYYNYEDWLKDKYNNNNSNLLGNRVSYQPQKFLNNPYKNNNSSNKNELYQLRLQQLNEQEQQLIKNQYIPNGDNFILVIDQLSELSVNLDQNDFIYKYQIVQKSQLYQNKQDDKKSQDEYLFKLLDKEISNIQTFQDTYKSNSYQFSQEITPLNHLIQNYQIADPYYLVFGIFQKNINELLGFTIQPLFDNYGKCRLQNLIMPIYLGDQNIQNIFKYQLYKIGDIKLKISIQNEYKKQYCNNNNDNNYKYPDFHIQNKSIDDNYDIEQSQQWKYLKQSDLKYKKVQQYDSVQDQEFQSFINHIEGKDKPNQKNTNNLAPNQPQFTSHSNNTFRSQGSVSNRGINSDDSQQIETKITLMENDYDIIEYEEFQQQIQYLQDKKFKHKETIIEIYEMEMTDKLLELQLQKIQIQIIIATKNQNIFQILSDKQAKYTKQEQSLLFENYEEGIIEQNKFIFDIDYDFLRNNLNYQQLKNTYFLIFLLDENQNKLNAFQKKLIFKHEIVNNNDLEIEQNNQKLFISIQEKIKSDCPLTIKLMYLFNISQSIDKLKCIVKLISNDNNVVLDNNGQECQHMTDLIENSNSEEDCFHLNQLILFYINWEEIDPDIKLQIDILDENDSLQFSHIYQILDENQSLKEGMFDEIIDKNNQTILYGKLHYKGHSSKYLNQYLVYNFTDLQIEGSDIQENYGLVDISLEIIQLQPNQEQEGEGEENIVLEQQKSISIDKLNQKGLQFKFKDVDAFELRKNNRNNLQNVVLKIQIKLQQNQNKSQSSNEINSDNIEFNEIQVNIFQNTKFNQELQTLQAQSNNINESDNNNIQLNFSFIQTLV